MTPAPRAEGQAAHLCWDHSTVTKCDDKEDERTCGICGKVWTEECNFNEDYA